jgi:hypothetical protein
MTRTKYVFGESTINEMDMENNWKEQFDKKWWYDRINLRLCSKDIPVYDEDDKLLGYNQNGAAVPEDIKAFISAEIIEKLIEDIPTDGMKVPLDDGRWLDAFDISALKQQLREKWL